MYTHTQRIDSGCELRGGDVQEGWRAEKKGTAKDGSSGGLSMEKAKDIHLKLLGVF